MKNLVLFGDSLLGRVGIDLINRVKEAIPGIEVYNCAAGGLNSRDGRERVAYIAKLKPDYAVLSFVANDCSPPYWTPVIPIEEYEDNLRTIIKAFGDSKVVVWLSPPADIPGDEKTTKEFNDSLIRYHDVARRVCRESGVEYIDSPVLYQALVDKSIKYHAEDGVHLNDEGYKPFIKALAQIIGQNKL